MFPGTPHQFDKELRTRFDGSKFYHMVISNGEKGPVSWNPVVLFFPIDPDFLKMKLPLLRVSSNKRVNMSAFMRVTHSLGGAEKFSPL